MIYTFITITAAVAIALYWTFLLDIGMRRFYVIVFLCVILFIYRNYIFKKTSSFIRYGTVKVSMPRLKATFEENS